MKHIEGWTHLLVRLPMVALLAILLMGCGANVDQSLTFYPNERWRAKIVISLPAQVIALGGDSTAVQNEAAKQVAEWEARGADVSWETRQENGLLIYDFDLKGQGLESARQVVLEDSAELSVVDVDGQRQIHFTQYPNQGVFSELSNYTLTLVGDEIISSNGLQQDRGVVRWVNPSGPMEAVLTEKSGFDARTLLIIGGVVATVGGGWVILRRGRRRAGPCPHCGAWVETGAQYCPFCGQKR